MQQSVADCLNQGSTGNCGFSVTHARGSTFYIYVIPDNKKVIGDIYNYKNKVEVYGVISGSPGWTESYGWLHRGPWVDDFNKLVKEKREAKNWRETKNKEEADFRNEEEKKTH